LVRRNSNRWKELKFGDGEFFPGYGKIFERTFDVLYCNIGSNDKIIQPEFKDKAILSLANGIRGNYHGMTGIGLVFESLKKKQGYRKLLTTVDTKERKRWYFGLKGNKTNIYLYCTY